MVLDEIGWYPGIIPFGNQSCPFLLAPAVLTPAALNIPRSWRPRRPRPRKNFRTSKQFTKYGPSHPLFITKTLKIMQEKCPNSFEKYYFAYMDFQYFDNFGEDGHRQIPKNRLMKSPKSWI